MGSCCLRTRTEPVRLAGPLLSPPSLGYQLSGGQGILRAGGQGPGPHQARTLTLTAAHHHSPAASQEFCIDLCRKLGCNVQPLLMPLEVGRFAEGRLTGLGLPQDPGLGRRRCSRPHTPTRTYGFACICKHTPSAYTSTHVGFHVHIHVHEGMTHLLSLTERGTFIPTHF